MIAKRELTWGSLHMKISKEVHEGNGVFIITFVSFIQTLELVCYLLDVSL
ncbi:hypothetical protein HanXRQr2_Chr09g0379331 [Helianthus annuus]|uniref:Uncharacterized protein n=1 Tax=Helianthus annuus TaxID=4232 RepID=A0A9K3N8A4_HELAN|nr:hypothetical protein HanXRQr2_Chr09g0379331 [Helianthus annuus]